MATVTSGDDGFKALRRKARQVRSRHPKAKRAAGGAPVSPGMEVSIDPLPSQNIPQKELPALPSTPTTPESRWRAAGEFDVLVYCKPRNDRLLLIRLDGGTNASVVMKPKERAMFGTGIRIWVRPTARPGVYELAGRYNQWGRRVVA